jgi:hypothetical protein
VAGVSLKVGGPILASNPGSILASAEDYSLNFHGIRPKEEQLPLEFLMAVLNSPVANAWLHGKSRKRWIVVTTLEGLPCPAPGSAGIESIVKRVRQLEQAKLSKWKRQQGVLFHDDEDRDSDIVRLTAEIDDAIYDAYGMTKSERRNVEKMMGGDKRPL